MNTPLVGVAFSFTIAKADEVQDLNFWYANGPGNPAASAQGIGYVQELVARLTQKPITTFDSAVNKSIVTNKALFPLNQPIFVDATHDTVLSTSAVELRCIYVT